MRDVCVECGNPAWDSTAIFCDHHEGLSILEEALGEPARHPLGSIPDSVSTSVGTRLIGDHGFIIEDDYDYE